MEGNFNMFKRENFGELTCCFLKCGIRTFLLFSGNVQFVDKIGGLLVYHSKHIPSKESVLFAWASLGFLCQNPRVG